MRLSMLLFATNSMAELGRRSRSENRNRSTGPEIYVERDRAACSNRVVLNRVMAAGFDSA